MRRSGVVLAHPLAEFFRPTRPARHSAQSIRIRKTCCYYYQAPPPGNFAQSVPCIGRNQER